MRRSGRQKGLPGVRLDRRGSRERGPVRGRGPEWVLGDEASTRGEVLPSGGRE
jgi:hypothetical protein